MSDLFAPNVIPAIYHGMCPECDAAIEPGELIVKREAGWSHYEHRAKREPAVCPRCFIAHAGECF